jgi:hypothetical protein
MILSPSQKPVCSVPLFLVVFSSSVTRKKRMRKSTQKHRNRRDVNKLQQDRKTACFRAFLRRFSRVFFAGKIETKTRVFSVKKSPKIIDFLCTIWFNSV